MNDEQYKKLDEKHIIVDERDYKDREMIKEDIRDFRMALGYHYSPEFEEVMKNCSKLELMSHYDAYYKELMLRNDTPTVGDCW